MATNQITLVAALKTPQIPPQAVPPLDLRGAAPLLDIAGNPVPPPLMANQWWIPLNNLFSTVNTISAQVTGILNSRGVIFDTHANRTNYAPANYASILYFETDRYVIYGSVKVPGTTTPQYVWLYMAGESFATQATLPADLGLNDAEFLCTVDDYGHRLRWNTSGTPHWEWAPGDPGSGMFADCGVAPTGPGWHICDGSTVPYLKSDGTLGSILLPDAVGVPTYTKSGAYSATITAAVPPTIGTPVFTGTPGTTGTTIGITGSGATGNTLTQTHNHTFTPAGTVSAPSGSLPGDPVPNFTAPKYFRQ